VGAGGGAVSGGGGDVNAGATDGSATVTLTNSAAPVEGDALILNGNVSASSGGWANVEVAATNASIAQRGGSTVTAAGSNGAFVSFNSAGAAVIDGDIVAAATADGTTAGAHTGSANIDITTTGGTAATITQGSGSNVTAVGEYARVSVMAGDSDPSEHPAQAAAFNLAGTLQVIDSIGGSILDIGGASGTVHDFSVVAGNTLARATIVASSGDLVLDGTGAVSGNYDSDSGAGLTATAAGSLDTSAAALTVVNTNTGSTAGARATLTAGNGAARLGSAAVSTDGAGAASFTAISSGNLSAGGDLAAIGNEGSASIELTSASGNMSLGGNIAATGDSGATVSATATAGTLNLTAGTALASSGSDAAAIALTSDGAMTIDGDVAATATNGSATVELLTTGGGNAAITQGVASTISAEGRGASMTIRAGSGDAVDVAQLANVDLDGALAVAASLFDADLTVDSRAGSIHDFSVTAANQAGAYLTAYQATGDLTLNGRGVVHSDGNSLLRTIAPTGTAELIASAGHDLTVNDLEISGTAAGAKLTAATGAVSLGDVAVTGTGSGSLYAAALTGDLSQQTATALTVAATADSARADLIAGGRLTLRDIAVNGADATLNAAAWGGALNLAAGTVQQAGASGAASVQMTASGAATIDSNVLAGSTGDAATIDIDSSGALTQGSHSLIRAAGVDAATLLHTGSAMALAGSLQARATTGAATLGVNGGAGSLHDFSVASSGGLASAEIVSGGALTLDGTGAVTGNHNSADGAALTVTVAGALDQRGAGLAVANANSGAQAGAAAALTSGGDLNNGSIIAVDANGGGAAALTLHSGGALQVDSDLLATAHNTGAGLGSASIALTSGNDAGAATSIRQSKGSRILAGSGGVAAGDASVLAQAGHCCDATVELLGAVAAKVDSGAGQASVTVRGNSVAVQGLTARADGQGGSLIDLAAPTQLTVNGLLTSQAASGAARAGIKLITDKLSYLGPNAAFSNGNGHVQLAPFNTTWLIGVESAPDFDATPAVNYNMALLQKFVGQGAELEFGGAYDRSAWVDAEGNVCVPGMGDWKDIGQHTGDIHVAGNGTGHLQLAASSMVFDTTGTSYYHDNRMSPWSVPTGRTAIYVPRPTPSLDRYVERTDNSLQQPITGLESAAAASPLYAGAAVVVPEGTLQIADNMFMAGDGINMTAVGGAGGNGNAGAKGRASGNGNTGANGSASGNGGAGADGGAGVAPQSSSDTGFSPDDDDDDQQQSDE
jgi:hypothetical protein